MEFFPRTADEVASYIHMGGIVDDAYYRHFKKYGYMITFGNIVDNCNYDPTRYTEAQMRDFISKIPIDEIRDGYHLDVIKRDMGVEFLIEYFSGINPTLSPA